MKRRFAYSFLAGIFVLAGAGFKGIFPDAGIEKASAEMTYIPDDYPAAGTSFSDPAVLVRLNDEILSSAIDTAFPEETYAEQDRTYAGISSVSACGDRLWAVFRAGGEAEGKNNYFAIYYSDDRGDNWIYYMIMDHPSVGISCGLGTPFFWTAPNGKLWLFYSQSGLWAAEFTGADGAVDEMTWEIRQLDSSYCVQKKPVLIENAESGKTEWAFMAFKGTTSKDYTYFYSDDEGKTWKTRGTASSTNPYRKANWGEPCFYQKTDGTIFCLCRLENGGGGFEMTSSSDYGATWSPFVMNLDPPFTGPSSKPDFLRLKSGALIFVNHDTTISRTKLTVWISDDDGETWSAKLLLDDRSNVAYPEAVQSADGTIYVIYDRNRLPYDGEGSMEVRVARITEADIRAGKLTDEASALKLCVSKKDFYKDLTEVKTDFPNELSFASAVTAEDIVSRLPAEVVVVDENGEEYTIGGGWAMDRSFKAGKAGTFTCSFTGELPSGVYDVNNLLTVSVTVEEKNKTDTAASGCGSLFGGPGGCAAAAFASGAGLTLSKKRRKQK